MASISERRRSVDTDADLHESTFGTLFDVNWLGLWTLYTKEVQRFFKVITQTVLAPMITTLIFLAVFALALGRSERMIGDLTFLQFLAPGLIMMAIIQNAFANTSSSIGIAKIQGNIIDYLMPPLSARELVLGVTLGGVTRGLLVGLAVWVVMLPVIDLPWPNLPLLLFYAIISSTILALMGFVAALWAEKFDQMAAVTNFVITPLSFLSGTFYSIDDLPAPADSIAHANPFFFMIDGLRYAFTGHHDGPVWLGAAVLIASAAGMWWLTLYLVRSGYKLRP